jgi:hypothetical protein
MSSREKNEEDSVQATSDERDVGPLVEGVDYYLENGMLVFTSYFLKRRGYCCENGCRHCPYEFNSKTTAGR